MQAEISARLTTAAGTQAQSHAELVRRSCAGLVDSLLGPRAEPYVIRAWERCLSDYMLEPDGNPPSEFVGSSVLDERRGQLGPLTEIARAEMMRLFRQIAPSRYLLLLTDAEGLILEMMCEPGDADSLRRLDLAPGFIWDERHEGTNGPGTCLHDRKPTLVHRAEHFFSRNVSMTCSAAPLWGPNGELLGVLDASYFDCTDSRQSQVPTLALISTSSRIVEQAYFRSSFRNCWILRFHEQMELVNQLPAAMLAVDENGVVRAADSAAPGCLGLDGFNGIIGRSIDDLFEVSTTHFYLDARARPHQVWPTTNCSGDQVYIGIHPPQDTATVTLPAKSRTVTRASQRANLSAHRLGDPAMAHNVWCAERVMNRDIHILLQGETGTGKDSFARAIHQSGERHDKPFIALSCAAIPESLIESELFGYDSGAFTGARAGGMRGKVVAAHGGTLFLDEIGDMPLSLQARLLRLLEEKEVTPLGRSRPISVDIRVISATNRDLNRMVQEGSFRTDLYYRLGALVLTLPPLRSRHDMAQLIRTIAAEENAGRQVDFSSDAWALLLVYRWPGNIRELRNMLATALALADGQRIERWHLGFGLNENVHAESPAAAQTNPLATAERERLLLELEQRHWNATATAAALGISRNTLYRKLRKHGISVGPAVSPDA
jgi:transcriptional regulator of acetoin/glycerol metabolism